MAISFDAAVAATPTGGTSNTWSHTCSGTNRILFVFVYLNSGGADLVTGVTYNGVALTLIDKQGNSDSGNDWTYLFYLINPSTGANNVVVSASTSVGIFGMSSSYTGANQSGQPDASAKQTAANGGTVTTTLTTIANNCWTVLGSGGARITSASTGSTQRATDTAGSAIYDSNGPITPPGSTSMSLTTAAGDRDGYIMASFSPVASATANSGFFFAVDR